MSAEDTAAIRSHFGIPHSPQTQELDTIDRLCCGVDRYRAALEEIAGGECWQGRCPEDDLCDTCTARKALDGDR